MYPYAAHKPIGAHNAPKERMAKLEISIKSEPKEISSFVIKLCGSGEVQQTFNSYNRTISPREAARQARKAARNFKDIR